MTAHSYLEYALTLLGWLINNGIWNTITATGLFALPLLIKLIAVWLKAREQGVDEGNTGALTIAWMENVIYVAIIVIMFTCVPLLNVDITEMKFDMTRSRQCNISLAQPDHTGYKPLINEVSGKTAAVPVWWYLIHTLSKGLVNAATASLPCQPDLRQIRFEVQHTRLSDPVLAQELQDFVQECYAPSLVRLKQHVTSLSQEETDDISWIGSSFFLSHPGYYDTDHARSPRSQWPYDEDRDAGLVDTGNGGYPTCNQWWSDSDIGLRSRVLSLVNPSIWQALQKLSYSQPEYEEAVLRSVVSQRNMEVSQTGRVYPGFGGNIDTTMMNQLTRDGATAGQAIASLAAFPAFVVVDFLQQLRQAFKGQGGVVTGHNRGHNVVQVEGRVIADKAALYGMTHDFGQMLTYPSGNVMYAFIINGFNKLGQMPGFNPGDIHCANIREVIAFKANQDFVRMTF